MPIPVGGPFERVGVDVLKMPKTERGNDRIVVFVDYRELAINLQNHEVIEPFLSHR